MNKGIITGTLLIVLSFLSIEQAEAKEPFDIAAGHSMQKIKRDGSNLYTLQFNPRIYLDVACDESESFQLVVIPNGQSISAVQVLTEPIEEFGHKLELKWHLVGYVRTGNPSYRTESVGWWPDPLLPATDFNVPADWVQPLWFTVTVPVGTKPGVYRSTITIRASARRSKM